MALTTYEYENAIISFDFGDTSKMVNATQMAKPFGKRVNDFLRLRGTKEYIELLEQRYTEERMKTRAMPRDIVKMVQGGTPELQGTWMDEKLALKFAAWLNPAFELWVYDKIEELLKTGSTDLYSGRDYAVFKSIRRMLDVAEDQQRQIDEINNKVDFMAEKLDDVEARLTIQDENYYTVAGYCKMNGVYCPHDKAKKWGLQATKLSNHLGKEFFKVHSIQWGEVGAYHIDILEQIVK